MNRLKLLWGKKSLVTVFSVAFMVFGLGCISWAIFNIWSQSNYVVEVPPSHVLKHVSVPNKVLYPVYPVDGDNIGSLSIPVLKQKLPIVQGTGMNELKKGIGHFSQSVLPGEKDNCVLSAHRDTVFSKIGNLKIGDHLIVQTSAGIFTYEVNGTRIVHEDDKTVIVPTANAVLTLTTCYPFKFIGDAPDRYIVSAALIESK
ncbi:class D sortase [Clostridium psychrophilum]|uniref:class D sortase n=1 Tax=Clostridium psychrophilum TaxID=132926 RepID=UPI001C0E0B89|nr:class D sortase [Clostridium psychrophilum]MBU3181233.1 class D sortase [Clostridium psychrophilum]